MAILKFLFILILFFPSLLYSQALWQQHKGNCDNIFHEPEKATINELKLCVNLWEAYRNIQGIKEEERLMAARAMQRLYKEGDEEGRHVAKNALARIGFPPPAEEDKRVEEKKREEKKREKYIPREVSKKEKNAAKQYRLKGYKFYRNRDYDNAIVNFEKAIEIYPGYVQAIYDSACTYSLMGQEDMAIEYLQRLIDIGTRDALDKVYSSRVDKDFYSLRENPKFKRVSGFCKIKLINGLKEEYSEHAEEELYRIETLLQKMKFTEITKGKDKHVRERPIIWYKDHSKHQAYIFMKIIDHPKTIVVPIDWDSEFDIIISWADVPEKKEDGTVVMKYSAQKKRSFDEKDVDKELDSLFREEDNALRKPDEYARKTESVVTTPERAASKVETAVDRIESTGKTIDRALDKTEDLFKKLK